jgi:hypothetical protein
MSSLIAIAVFDTIENQRTAITKKSFASIKETVDLDKHDLYLIDNDSCEETKDFLSDFIKDVPRGTLITNEKNVGTAKAINMAWKQRKPGQHCIKQDNDVLFHEKGWVDLLEEAINRSPDKVGILALKRKDLAENPNRPQNDHYRSELFMFPHKPGEKWIVGEQVNHAFGTVQMYNSALLDVMGGLYQMDGLYGFDDSLASVRCKVAGFIPAFLPQFNIDHLDLENPGEHVYQKWKESKAKEFMDKYERTREAYINGSKDIYHPFE